jgi:hypothetical protein
MTKNNVKFDFNDLISKIKNYENFSFSRFGDGEFNCAFGKLGRNCDEHEYFSDMSIELLKILSRGTDYIIGIQNLGYTIWKNKIDEFNNLNYCNSDIIHNASIKNNLNLFFESIKGRGIILVAPKYFSDFEKLKPNTHIIIPEKNCWLSKNEIFEEIKNHVKKDSVILYSASMMSNILIDLLYNIYSNNITQIDCGSVFDPYMGINKRKYHQSIIDRVNNEYSSL